jgi:putative MFS transporter
MSPSESIGVRLDQLPITRTHRVLVATAGIGAFFDLFDVFLAGVLATVLTNRFHLGRVALPSVIAASFLGMFIGALGLGRFADRVGRRRAFVLTLGIYSVFTLLGAFATSAAMLIATRFLAGIGIGAELPLIDTYLSEVLPARHRGRYTAVAYTIGFMGVPAAGILARVVVPLQPAGVEGWRWLFVAGSMGSAVIWRLRRQLTESPRWLASVGRVAEAHVIVARLEHEAGQNAVDAALCPGDSAVRSSPGFQALFSRQLAGRTAMLFVFHAFQTVGYYGFGTLVPLVLASKGFSVVTSLTYTTVVYVGYPLGSALSLPLVERFDRRWLIVGSAGLMASFGLALGRATTATAIMPLGFAYTLVSNVFSNALHIFQAEIFPTPVRATAAGTGYSVSRLSSAAMPFILLPVLQRWGATVMFGVVAIAMGVVIIDVALFAPSTTGRPLEDVL